MVGCWEVGDWTGAGVEVMGNGVDMVVGGTAVSSLIIAGWGSTVGVIK